jgi:hypothetical protein
VGASPSLLSTLRGSTHGYRYYIYTNTLLWANATKI